MSTARQLYGLQEIDLQIAANEREQARLEGLLGESEEVRRLREEIAAREEERAGLERQQRSAEMDADTLSAKLAEVEEALFSGRVRNPKELTNLQREADDLKARRDAVEEQALLCMERAEEINATLATMTGELKRLESAWQQRQAELAAELASLRQEHTALLRRREAAASQIEAGLLAIYQELRARRGTAVARVEQGTCRGCQISLPTTDLQRVRGGGVVRCGSCGRILYLP